MPKPNNEPAKILTLAEPNVPDDASICTDPVIFQRNVQALQEDKTQLSHSFVTALIHDFNEHGLEAIQYVRKDNPGQYLRLIAQIMPKEVNIDVTKHQTTTGQLADDPTLQFLRTLVIAPDGGGPDDDGPPAVQGDVPQVEPGESED